MKGGTSLRVDGAISRRAVSSIMSVAFTFCLKPLRRLAHAAFERFG
jgi:hypothetical protein